MKTIAFIFARGGSKGIKNKNIKLFLGKPLIFYTIKLAKKNRHIDDVYVSTDCSKIKKISIRYGAKVIDRPKYLAKDNSPEILSWKHAINFLKKKNINFNIFLSLPCTSPLRSNIDVNNIIISLRKKIDIVVGITRAKKNPYFNILKLNKKNILKKLFEKKIFFRRQDAPKVIDLTTVGYAANKNFIINCKSIFDGKVKGVLIPEERSIDIDNLFDFKIAEMIKKNFYE